MMFEKCNLPFRRCKLSIDCWGCDQPNFRKRLLGRKYTKIYMNLLLIVPTRLAFGALDFDFFGFPPNLSESSRVSRLLQ